MDVVSQRTFVCFVYKLAADIIIKDNQKTIFMVKVDKIVYKG